jgi:hypothetical protein
MNSNPQSDDRANLKRDATRRSRALPILAPGALMALGTGASAHDVWSNGDPVPAWVKKACSGPEDVHHLTPDQVHLTPLGWRVDGYPDLIPVGKELPSPDGGYWISTIAVQRRRVHSGLLFPPFNGT